MHIIKNIKIPNLASINKMIKSSNIKTIFYGFFLFVWTSVIFSFSMQTAPKSSKLSAGLLEKILKLIYNITTIKINSAYLHDLFRKLAHFTEFFILGAFAFLFFNSVKWHFAIFNKTNLQKYSQYSFARMINSLATLIYGIAISISDEVIQYFTGSGRAMRFTDVLIDSSGVLIFLAFIWLIYKIFLDKYEKNGCF